jgi:hypothetical protein
LYLAVFVHRKPASFCGGVAAKRSLTGCCPRKRRRARWICASLKLMSLMQVGVLGKDRWRRRWRIELVSCNYAVLHASGAVSRTAFPGRREPEV